MSAAHTPGPWNITESSEHWGRINCTVTSEDGDVATVWQQGTTLNRANARLIAAAPDLLDALKLMVEQFTKGSGHSTLKDSEARIKAHAAIAKAEGRS